MRTLTASIPGWSPMVSLNQPTTRLRRAANIAAEAAKKAENEAIRSRVSKKGANILKNRLNKIKFLYADKPQLQLTIKVANFLYKKGDYMTAYKKYKTANNSVQKLIMSRGPKLGVKILTKIARNELDRRHQERLKNVEKSLGRVNFVAGPRGLIPTNLQFYERTIPVFGGLNILRLPPDDFKLRLQYIPVKDKKYSEITNVLKNMYNRLSENDTIKRNYPSFSKNNIQMIASLQRQLQNRYSKINVMNANTIFHLNSRRFKELVPTFHPNDSRYKYITNLLKTEYERLDKNDPLRQRIQTFSNNARTVSEIYKELNKRRNNQRRV
jgi:hypothetical protein